MVWWQHKNDWKENNEKSDSSILCKTWKGKLSEVEIKVIIVVYVLVRPKDSATKHLIKWWTKYTQLPFKCRTLCALRHWYNPFIREAQWCNSHCIPLLNISAHLHRNYKWNIQWKENEANMESWCTWGHHRRALIGQVWPKPWKNGSLDAHMLLLAKYEDSVVDSIRGCCEVQQHPHSSIPSVHRQSNMTATQLTWCYVGIWNQYWNVFG